MKTVDEIYIKWYGEYREGKHPEKSERDIIICAMEEYADLAVTNYKISILMVPVREIPEQDKW